MKLNFPFVRVDEVENNLENCKGLELGKLKYNRSRTNARKIK
jgi:hypothetical protein